MTFYITFGLGSVLGKSYLVAHTPNENLLRLQLNKLRLPWCGCYYPYQFNEAIAAYNLVKLPKELVLLGHES